MLSERLHRAAMEIATRAHVHCTYLFHINRLTYFSITGTYLVRYLQLSNHLKKYTERSLSAFSKNFLSTAIPI